MAKKIVFAGGPATGKTTLIHRLESMGYSCLHEISRQITIDARQAGIEQLFISNPILFSEKLLKGRINQYTEATLNKTPIVFIDRGLPEVVAHFIEACETFRYDYVFIFPPWEEIYTADNERYEDFKEALRIYPYLKGAYEKFGYKNSILPKDTVENRISFILDTIA
jgi:predicted ATPase